MIHILWEPANTFTFYTGKTESYLISVFQIYCVVIPNFHLSCYCYLIDSYTTGEEMSWKIVWNRKMSVSFNVLCRAHSITGPATKLDCLIAFTFGLAVRLREKWMNIIGRNPAHRVKERGWHMLTRELGTSAGALLLPAFTQRNLSDQGNCLRVTAPVVHTRHGVLAYSSPVCGDGFQQT